jgi:hypothetical protein
MPVLAHISFDAGRLFCYYHRAEPERRLAAGLAAPAGRDVERTV